MKSSEKISLVERDKIISFDEKNAKSLNKFFFGTVKNLKIEELSATDPWARNITHSV